ncbi:Exonuclease RNase T/DNA polymerase III [Penicillium angulare]|uniref:Exonuclease RNase T/DNA polymerase III n=1 Tax=Penicillium angulare TaxID=116970 RepID=UPI002540D095|nr:Exonuclease RNase T/DNA polymerase III [Penicillium angulare]KAJ5263645.1 Exonuclease RNase T/DNA polymerase III [Penicillium angulare]
MVGVRKKRQVLAFLSVVDLLTGKILISRYVVPSEEVVDWRSEFSGITKDTMNSAILSGAVFSGWLEARDKLWELMDDSTILVGQSLKFDLEVLGICHANIVDTAILTAEAVFPSIIPTKPLPRMWSLKSLAKDFLSLEIQNSNIGHSALEDAYAAREIAIWCSRNPEGLKLWAEKARRREKESKLKKKPQSHRKGSSKGDLPVSQSSRVQEHDTAYYEYYDDFRLSDLAEELGWPEGWDPWSD